MKTMKQIESNKRSFIKSLLWFCMYYLFFCNFCIDVLGLPSAVSYGIDFILLFILFFSLISRRIYDFSGRYYTIFLMWIGILFASTLAGLFIVYGSPLLYLWGLRNTFRYYILVWACSIFLDLTDIPRMLSYFKMSFVINLVLCTIEYAMGYRGDNIGGMFGTATGCNGYLNLFLIIIVAISTIEYLNKTRSMGELVFILLGSFYMMAIAELKVFVFELAAISILAILHSKYSARDIVLVVLGVAGFLGGIAMLGYFFENFGFDFFFSGEIFDYLGDRGYTGSGDLNRFNAVPELYRRFLSENVGGMLFGIGLGNASYSDAFSFFNSSFYLTYQDLHYQWFSDALVYIETGAIGLVLFESFFVGVFFACRKLRKNKALWTELPNQAAIETMVQVAGVVALMSIFVSVYNSSLHTDAGYMVYFLLSVPIVIDRQLALKKSPPEHRVRRYKRV